MISPSSSVIRPGRGQGDDVELGVAQPPRGVLVDRFVGIVLRGCRDRDPPRRHEPREIVDMAVGMVVHQARAEPHDAFETEVVEEPLLGLLRGSACCGWG